ncbi:restriction endonuclease subunit S [Legionella pneumophila]|uniref:Restriction endonuclease subunit S n=1 Tax=Legionella pneumophila TaxID=446 RepID=A0AAP3HG73_LEGPN|nr:restriction endonuclease subunit S [Legionella pneumophila]HAT9431693.1 restriction endonuclease subunit S [Legionella pneumophila subsp. pneumophila]ADG23855.1 hypothetical protein lpa_00830 [Legionella pneumophila 2300/99 Alcoy]MCZ4693028.1 restriction endonuclease subunit S [Legionella pneumophila]MCZ4710326.1 restriction endonuclease subunit S [Legionella pneumophila]MCZ4720352.1 restriction endonuclease subunit S [Legionella pneumophila]
MKQVPNAGIKMPFQKEDWHIKRFKYLFKKLNRPVMDDDGVITAFRDGLVTLRSNRRMDGFTFADKEIGYQGVEPNDLVIHAMDSFAGAIGVSDSRGKCSPVYSIAIPINPNAAYPKFWGYYLRNLATAGFIESLAKGIRERSTDFRWKDISNLLVNFPNYEIQKGIADFLDHETDRIDQLIEKKVGLISVLKEKSTALVTENVLQGHRVYPEKTSAEKYTHPDKFWPDGLNGLLQPLKFFCEETASLSDKTDPNMEIHYIDIGNVSFADGLKGSAKYLFKDAPSRARQVLRMHDVIISTVRTYLKACAYIDKDLPNLIASTGFCVLRPNDKIHPKYLYRAIQSDPFISGVVVRSEGVSYPAVNDKMIKALKIPVPDLGLQKSISDKIEQEIHSVTQTTRLIEKSIDLLSSFKSSLITEAVTGKLDINSWRKRGTTDERLDNIEESMRT